MRIVLGLTLIGMGCGTSPHRPTSVLDPAPIATSHAADAVVVTVSDPCGFLVNQIYFAKDRASLGERQNSFIVAMAANFECLRRECQSLHIEVAGHASIDEVGPGNLSMERSIAVQEALEARGVAPGVLWSHGYGAEAPVDSQHTTVVSEENQRVEFSVVSTGCY